MRKILGVNISHNCSFAYFENNILKEYYEEDRFNKIKHFMATDKEYQYEVLKKFKNIEFDKIYFASYGRLSLLKENKIINNILKQVNYKNYFFNPDNHHILHATSGYYFSNFEEALAIITDGGGEIYINQEFQIFQALESIFKINKKEINCFFKRYSNKRSDYFDDFTEKENNLKINNIDVQFTNKTIGGFKYLKYLQKANMPENTEGQLMGLAAYRGKETNLDKNLLNIAYEAQEETLKDRIKLIEKAITYSDCKNIILSGGYHLNCANNFKLVKHFPKLNFFIDPIPYDAGTAVGAVFYYENYI